MSTRSKSIVMFMLALSFATSAEAVSIGLNLVGGRGSGGTGTGGTNGNALLATDSAGVIAQTNWNNGFGANNAGPVALLDSNGNATGASAAWAGVPNVFTISGSAAVDANAALMNGYIDTNNSAGFTTITITNVPYTTYDVIVYADGDGTNRSGLYTVNGSSIQINDIANFPIAGPAPTFASFNDATLDNIGNFARFSSFGNVLTITANEALTGGGFRAPINAIQIINTHVPEPATATLGLMAFGGLMLRRRRMA